MFRYSLRFFTRFAILVPGLIIAYFSVRDIFPYFNHRLPVALAILITYVLAAYILIPAFIRLVRIVRPADHLPLYCVTPDGFASDPLNIGIIANRRELITVMEKAGWQVADRHTFRNVARMVACVILERPYLRAPVSSLYLFGRKQDIAFELSVDGGPVARHHVRFWATTYERKPKLSAQTIHWHHRKTHVYGDSLLWVGAASLDVGISVVRHNLQLTHMIDEDTNSERELIVSQLREQKLVKSTKSVTLDQPYRLINRVMSGQLHTDGKMTVISLKDSK